MDMTNGQMTVTAPETDRPEAEQTPVFAEDGFASLVRYALQRAGLPSEDIAGAAEAIQSAHQMRIDLQQHKTDDAERATGSYAAMDRANQTCMQYVKRIVATATEVNARQHAYCESLGQMRDRLRQYVDTADAAGEPTLPLPLLQQLANSEIHLIPPAPPVTVGMAVDHRFRYGTFEHTLTGHEVEFTFLGWSLVVHHPLINTTLEPTFLGPHGEPATRLALALDGLELQGLR